MTTLMYVQGPPLTPEEAALDAEFGRAYYGASTNPDASNKQLEALAAKGMIAAHVELYNRYRWGNHLPKDGDAARRHLLAALKLAEETAADQNMTPMGRLNAGSAMAMVAHEYLQDDPLEDPEWGPARVLEPNRDEGLKWLRKAASIEYRPAALTLAETLRAGRPAKECTPEELHEIVAIYEKYGERSQLAAFYCPDLTSPDWPDADKKKAIDWYVKGKNNGCEYCESALKEWEAANKPAPISPPAAATTAPAGREGPPAAAPPPRASTSHDTDRWTLMGIVLTPIALALWFVIGSALIWAVAAFQSFALPIVIVGVIVGAIVNAWHSRR